MEQIVIEMRRPMTVDDLQHYQYRAGAYGVTISGNTSSGTVEGMGLKGHYVVGEVTLLTFIEEKPWWCPLALIEWALNRVFRGA